MSHSHVKIADVDDVAPGFGVDSMECRPIRDQLGAKEIGLSSYRVKPGRRVGFGHDHDAVEEIYLVTSGSGRFKVDDEFVEVSQGSVLYCSPEVTREWEAGDDGMELVAFGSHAEGDGNLKPEWWTD